MIPRHNSPFHDNRYRPQFSGHETFPLRYGWLKKAFDAVFLSSEGIQDKRELFLGEDAIARFGVGKNMVASLRHWATATGILRDISIPPYIQTTTLGDRLFGPEGLDPYMEHPTTLWLIHWQLAAKPEKTTWFYAFNHFSALVFDRDQLVQAIGRLAKDHQWSRVSLATIRNDVACFLRTYALQPGANKSTQEDALESPLTELGLIKAVGKRDGFQFVRGMKPNLYPGAFAYGVMRFWEHFPHATTLSFEMLAHAPGSPGRIFVLEEDDLAERLIALEDITHGALRWSETAGLKQLIKKQSIDEPAVFSFIQSDYHESTQPVRLHESGFANIH